MQVTHSCLVPQNLDLTKRKMVHEGPLSWKINKDKTIGKPLLSNFPKACFFWWLYNSTSVCFCLRAVYFTPGRHPGVVAEAGRAFYSQVSQQEPRRNGWHETHIQSNHQTQHCAGALGGDRWASDFSFVTYTLPPHIFQELILTGFLDFPTQITDHSLWSPCPKTEHRFMSWWHKQCPSRECKFSPLLSFSCFCNPLLSSL